MEDLKYRATYYLGSLVSFLIVFGLLALAGSKRERIPGRLQNFFEFALEGLRGLFMGALGEGGEKHLPLIFTLFFYILVGNFLGLVPPFHSPTAATSTTIALGLIVFFYVQYIGIKANGLLGYLKHFLGPIIFLAPLFLIIEIVGELAKPFSLAMRLFGNIFGEDQIVKVIFDGMKPLPLWAHLIPFQILINFLQCFTNLVQAFIFALLSCAYISIMSQQHHDEGDAYEPRPHEKEREEYIKESLAGLGGNL